MENKKYELTDFTMRFEGRILYRIRALKDFSDVKKGELGGWVQSENNLSQEHDCWIYNDGKCMDNAIVCDDSYMCDYSKMYNNSRLYNNSMLYDYSEMRDNSKMFGDSIMLDCSYMCDDSKMYDHSSMFGYSEMHGNSKMYGKSTMLDDSKMFGDSIMYGNSKMRNNSILKDNEKLYGKLVSKVDKFIEIHSKKGRIITGVLKEGKILFNVGCQNEITKEIFIDRIYNEDGGIEEHPYRKEYLKIIDMIELYFKQ